MALISVIIPVYKVEKYINQCIDSVINQSFKDIEIILVDDGSPDNCPKICDEYKRKDSRIKVIHKENGGLSHARNCGIKLATSQYIIFLDSDDYWVTDSLIHVANCINDGEEVDIVFLSAAKYFQAKNKMESNFEGLNGALIKNKSQDKVLKYLARSQKFPVSACTKVIKKSLIIENNLYFEKGLLSEDIDWSTKLLLAAKKFDVCRADFYVYRKEREGSITNTVGLKNIRDMIYIIDKWANRWEFKGAEELREHILGLYSYEYLILMSHIFLLKKKERWEVYKEVLNLKWILKYSKSQKTKVIKFLVKLVGFKATSYLLNRYVILFSK